MILLIGVEMHKPASSLQEKDWSYTDNTFYLLVPDDRHLKRYHKGEFLFSMQIQVFMVFVMKVGHEGLQCPEQLHRFICFTSFSSHL